MNIKPYLKFFILFCSIISMGKLTINPVYAKTTSDQEMEKAINLPLPAFTEGEAAFAAIDLHNPETIELLEKAIKIAELKLSAYQNYPKATYKNNQVSDEINYINSRLCNFNISLSAFITRDQEIAEYCYEKLLFYNKRNIDKTLFEYPRTGIRTVEALYKVGKTKEAVDHLNFYIKALKNGLNKQVYSLNRTGHLRGGWRDLSVYELIITINQVNLALANYTNSPDNYQKALDEFYELTNKYAYYIKENEKNEKSVLLDYHGANSNLAIQKANMLVGLGRLEEAEKEFQISFDRFPFESLRSTDNYESLLVKQKKYEEALEISDFVRSLTIQEYWESIASDSEKRKEILMNEPRMTIEEIKEVARLQNATLVEYSLHEDNQLLIWVITPHGKTYLRQIDFSDNLAQTSAQKVQLSVTNNFNNQSLNFYLIFPIIAIIFLILVKDKLKKQSFYSLLIILILLTLQSCNPSKSFVSEDNDNLSKPSNSIPSFSHATISNIPSFKNLIQINYSLIDQKNGVKTPKIITSKADDYCQTSSQCLEKLHKILIDPIKDILPTNPEHHVIFIPDSNLFKVPFAALIDSQGKYLIEKHTIRYAPSIKVLKYLHNQNYSKAERYGSQALVVGNPIMPTMKYPYFDENKQEALNQLSYKSKKLSILPGTKEEAQKIAEIYKVSPLLGEKATGKAILKEMYKAKVIHLATHGFYTPEGVALIAVTPVRPSCVGGKSQCEGRASYYLEDGFLNTSIIIRNKTSLKADLVVLSACSTGITAFGDKRDNPNSLSSSNFIELFTAQGVPSIVGSLWQVPDTSTTKLMVAFHDNLQHDPDKAKALRQAMLTTMQDYPHPASWSAFSLFGLAAKPTIAISQKDQKINTHQSHSKNKQNDSENQRQTPITYYGSKGQYTVDHQAGTYSGCVNGTGCLSLGKEKKIGESSWKNGDYVYSINERMVQVHQNGKLIFQDTF